MNCERSSAGAQAGIAGGVITGGEPANGSHIDAPSA